MSSAWRAGCGGCGGCGRCGERAGRAVGIGAGMSAGAGGAGDAQAKAGSAEGPGPGMVAVGACRGAWGGLEPGRGGGPLDTGAWAGKGARRRMGGGT